MASSSSGNITVFGQETEFDGELSFTDTLVITGKFNGTIKSGGALVVERGASCSVDSMHVDSVVIGGDVRGNIHAAERVEMNSGSSVSGDVETAHLRIADNVEFEGQVKMLETEPDVDLFSVASDEFRQALVLRSREAH